MREQPLRCLRLVLEMSSARTTLALSLVLLAGSVYAQVTPRIEEAREAMESGDDQRAQNLFNVRKTRVRLLPQCTISL
jgi:hypothetical protein